MTTILLLTITLSCCLAALFRPWIGVLGYYVLALLAPQWIWPWIFEQYRISLYVGICTLLGLGIAFLRGDVNFKVLKSSQNAAILLIIIIVNLSHYLSPLSGTAIPIGMIPPTDLLVPLNTAVLFYFVAQLLVDEIRKLKWFLFAFAGVIGYYVFWANDIYFSGQMWVVSDSGRLGGPGGIYLDSNAFAMLLVVGMGFLYFMGYCFRGVVPRYFLWALIPPLWHAIFLTGSRGAFLVAGVVALLIGIKSKSKMIAVGLGVAFVIAAITQGGLILERTLETAETAREQQDEAIDPRILSWTVATHISLEYPLLGVGFGRFQQVAPHYAEKVAPEYNSGQALVAHNTLLQVSGGSGLIAGLLLLSIYIRIGLQMFGDRQRTISDPFLAASYDALLMGLVAFFALAMFLNLFTYEIMYYLLACWLIVNRLASDLDKQNISVPLEKTDKGRVSGVRLA